MSVTATSSENYSSTSATFTQILPIAASKRHFPKNLEVLIPLLPTYFILLVTDSLRQD